MRKKLKTFKAKNTAPQSLIDEGAIREHAQHQYTGRIYDASYAGWSWGVGRPYNSPFFLRRLGTGTTTATGTTGATNTGPG